MRFFFEVEFCQGAEGNGDLCCGEDVNDRVGNFRPDESPRDEGYIVALVGARSLEPGFES